LKLALEAVATAHKLTRGEEVPPQALPAVTAVTQDEERWARVMARAALICEEATASGAQPQLSEQEEKEARLIAEATRILREVTPPQLKTGPSALPAEAPERPHVPIAGGRLVVHRRGA
jgi:hypothetical protein